MNKYFKSCLVLISSRAAVNRYSPYKVRIWGGGWSSLMFKNVLKRKDLGAIALTIYDFNVFHDLNFFCFLVSHIMNFILRKTWKVGGDFYR